MTERRARDVPLHDDPFSALGLPRAAGLSDDDVRAAWRRIAAGTHPDRDDGGDPARFGVAAAAYAALRTAYGRGEALADLAGAGRRVRGRHARGRSASWQIQLGIGKGSAGRGQRSVRTASAARGRQGTRDDRGRLGRLVLRAAVAGAVGGVAVGFAGWAPATAGVVVGALTWLAGTSRHDLPPRA